MVTVRGNESDSENGLNPKSIEHKVSASTSANGRPMASSRSPTLPFIHPPIHLVKFQAEARLPARRMVQ
jgi:hypothetical protein